MVFPFKLAPVYSFVIGYFLCYLNRDKLPFTVGRLYEVILFKRMVFSGWTGEGGARPQIEPGGLAVTRG